MRQTPTTDRPAKQPATNRPGEQRRPDDEDREAVGTGDDEISDDEIDELEDDEDIEEEDDEA